MITTPIFTRLMSTTEYGIYNVFNSWYGIIYVFVTLSLCYGVFSQGIVKFEDDRNRFVSSLQGISLTLTLFWVFVYLLFRNNWNHLFSLTTIQMLALLVMCWANSSYTFWMVEQRTLYQYKRLVILTIFISLAKPTLGILLVIRAADKATARILGLAAVEFVVALYCFMSHIIREKAFVNLRYWKYAVLFSLPLIPHYLSQTVLNNSDRIMIERMAGADKAGIYSVAYSVSMIMVLFNSALGMTISPWMFKKIKSNKPQEIAPVAYSTLSFIASMNLILIAFAPEVVRIFAPPEYHEAIQAIPPIAMSSYYLFMYDYFSRFEFYYEKTTGIMLASILGAILNICLNYIFIGMFGYLAAAYTTLFCYIIYVLCHYFFMKRICRENHIYPSIYNPFILLILSAGFMTAGFFIMMLYDITWMRYSIIAIIMLVVLFNKNRLSALIKRFLALKKDGGVENATRETND